MSLSVSYLSGWPPINTTFAETKVPSFYPTGLATGGSNSPSPTVAAPYSFTLSSTSPNAGQFVYTQGATQYVAGIIDSEGVVPARIFRANNASGSYQSGAVSLPTLNYIVQQQTTGFDGVTNYGGYKIVLTPGVSSVDSGLPSSPNLNEFGQTAPATQFPAEPVLVQVPGYTTASPSGVNPQPQIVFYVSMNAALLLSTTAN